MDILFKNDDFVFSYRVGGILKHNGKILLQRPKNDDYAIIGGHVAAMETSMEMELSMESEKFILTDKPHSTVRKEGFPLDSISLDIKTNKYYYDLPEDKLEQVAVEDGFLEFFKNILNLN